MDSSSNTFFSNYPSVGKMTQEQLDQYPVEGNWVQDRLLFDYNHSHEKGMTYFGGYSYAGIINNLETHLKGDEHLFNRTFTHLQSSDIYVDIGAGNGNAIRNYRNRFPEGARVIGIANTKSESIEDIMEMENQDDKFSFYLCDFKQFPIDSLVNRVSVITDIKGAFRYGLDPALVIQKMGAMLKPEGIAFIDFGGGIRIKKLPDYPNLRLSQSSRMLLHLWSRTIKGFDYLHRELADCEKRTYGTLKPENEKYDLSSMYWFDQNVIVLKRNSDSVEVDRLVHDPKVFEIWEKSGKNWDFWSPEYTWEVSERNKAFLSEKEIWFND